MDRGWSVAGPLCFHEFYSNDVHQPGPAQVAPTCTIHHPIGPHRWCQKKSTLCHLLENFDIIHVLAEAFLGFLCKCPDSPISTIYCTEFRHFPLPTPSFSPLSLACRIRLYKASNRQCQNIPVGFCHQMVKNCHVLESAGQGQELLVNVVFHHCPNFRFISFICVPSVVTEEKIPLKNPFCGFFKIFR